MSENEVPKRLVLLQRSRKAFAFAPRIRENEQFRGSSLCQPAYKGKKVCCVPDVPDLRIYSAMGGKG
jgi:hypothetical protein